MRALNELVAMEQENFIACYRALAEAAPTGAVLEDDGVFAFVTGLPLPMFNGCIITTDKPSGLNAALDWLAEQGSPFSAWTPESVSPEAMSSTEKHGLQRQPEHVPGMTLHPIGASPAAPDGLTIEIVTPRSAADFASVVVGLGLGEETADLLTSAAFVERDDVDLFVGHLNGAAVGTSIAISSDHVGGVVNVLTLKDARGRGVGTALTWAAVQAGVDGGHDAIALQATPMGLPVYRSMGFETVVERAEFA